MYLTKRETEESCYMALNSISRFQEKIEDTRTDTDGFDDYSEFATRVARAVGKRMNDSSFVVKDEDTVDELWIETAINETNEILERLSFLDYDFALTEDTFLYLTLQDGRRKEVSDIDTPEEAVKYFIAEDILRISTGMDNFDKDVVDVVAYSIGDEIDFDKVKEIIRNKVLDEDTRDFCEEIISDFEEIKKGR